LIAETRRSPTPTAPSGAWGYIFREDIALVDDIDPAGAMEKIVKAETVTSLYNFLGVCGPVPWYKLHDGKHHAPGTISPLMFLFE
jgi:hypothetical protein